MSVRISKKKKKKQQKPTPLEPLLIPHFLSQNDSES